MPSRTPSRSIARIPHGRSRLHLSSIHIISPRLTLAFCLQISYYADFGTYTVIVARMSNWKWRETKQQPSRARSGHQISCCLVSLHFLRDILATITVLFEPDLRETRVMAASGRAPGIHTIPAREYICTLYCTSWRGA